MSRMNELAFYTLAGDPKVLDRFREDPVVRGFRGAIDAKATTEELEQIAKLIPDEWLVPAITRDLCESPPPTGLRDGRAFGGCCR